jgi:hypothetical protein
VKTRIYAPAVFGFAVLVSLGAKPAAAQALPNCDRVAECAQRMVDLAKKLTEDNIALSERMFALEHDLDVAKKELASRDVISRPHPNCLKVSDTAICWLQPNITMPPQTPTTSPGRLFKSEIPPVFSEKPTVVPSVMISDSAGFGFNIYKYELSLSDFHGSLVEVQGRNVPAAENVVMSVLAVGKAK